MFALDSNNNIVHIKDALSQTDYFCAKCGGRLRVRNGKIKIKHFYHHLDNDCGDRGESLIHRYWKEYFSKLKEFQGYTIIDSRIEFGLLNNTYIPDVILKTDKNDYIIIEICYKNPKTIEYLEKFKKLIRFIKVYEVEVDFDKIIEIKELYDKKEYEEEYDKIKNTLHSVKEYILNTTKNGGLKFEFDHHYPYFVPVIDKYLKMEYRWNYNPITKISYSYAYKDSIIPTKSKIYLSKSSHRYHYTIKSEPFYINIYNKKEAIETYKMGELFIKDFKLARSISVYLIED